MICQTGFYNWHHKYLHINSPRPSMHPPLSSPGVETFSTPPSTPFHSNDEIRPSLSRRTSRPSSIHTEYSQADWTPALVLEKFSPDVRKSIADRHVSLATTKVPLLPSPCSDLEPSQCPHTDGVHFALSPPNSTSGSAASSADEEDEGHGGSLTEQLAETAVGVREMSKQLGQCSRLRPKARDQPSFSRPFRSCPRSIQYPKCLDHHESQG